MNALYFLDTFSYLVSWSFSCFFCAFLVSFIAFLLLFRSTFFYLLLAMFRLVPWLSSEQDEKPFLLELDRPPPLLELPPSSSSELLLTAEHESEFTPRSWGSFAAVKFSVKSPASLPNVRLNSGLLLPTKWLGSRCSVRFSSSMPASSSSESIST